MVAHPNSTLGKLRDKIPHEKQQDVAKVIIKSFVVAINEVLGGHSDLKDTLESSRFLISQSSEKSNYTSWVLNDGSIVRNIVHSKTKPRSTMPWIGTNLKDHIRFRYSYNLNKEMEEREKRFTPEFCPLNRRMPYARFH